MEKLDPPHYNAVSRLYEASVPYFPLIGAVLERTQDGAVYADDPSSPKHAFVQHAFGFAQMFGAIDAAAESWLERHALIDRAFEGAKLRLYAPVVPSFLQRASVAPMRSERQRFQLRADAAHRPELPDGVACTFASAVNISLIDEKFGVVTRFWRTAADFIARSNCVLTTRGGEPVALCYAAALAGGRAEIDVLTLPQHRQLGLGRLAVEAFNVRCREASVEPLWDCFTNNSGSMMLARAVGFAPMTAPYAFFTIAK